MSIRERAKTAKSVRSQARSAFDARAEALGIQSLSCAERCAHLLGGSAGGEASTETISSLEKGSLAEKPKA